MKICHTLCFHLLSASNLFLGLLLLVSSTYYLPGVDMTQALKFRILVHKENALLGLAWQGGGDPTESNTDTGVMADGMGVLAMET